MNEWPDTIDMLVGSDEARVDMFLPRLAGIHAIVTFYRNGEIVIQDMGTVAGISKSRNTSTKETEWRRYQNLSIGPGEFVRFGDTRRDFSVRELIQHALAILGRDALFAPEFPLKNPTQTISNSNVQGSVTQVRDVSGNLTIKRS